jgi:trk system potassium uptake protein TrkH
MTLVLVYIVTVFVSTLMFTLYGYSLSDSLFETSSALATTGLSAGLTSHNLPSTLKLIEMIDMLLGRLEIFPYLALLHPRNYARG